MGQFLWFWVQFFGFWVQFFKFWVQFWGFLVQFFENWFSFDDFWFSFLKFGPVLVILGSVFWKLVQFWWFLVQFFGNPKNWTNFWVQFFGPRYPWRYPWVSVFAIPGAIPGAFGSPEPPKNIGVQNPLPDEPQELLKSMFYSALVVGIEKLIFCRYPWRYPWISFSLFLDRKRRPPA